MTTPPPLSGETPPPEPRGTARPWLAPAIASGLALQGLGILLIPGSILLPHLPTHLSGQKCAVPQKNDNCI